MAKAAGDPRRFISQVSLVGRSAGAFKTLRGFDKSRHTVPDAINSATQGFLARLCAAELAEEAEAVFQRARSSLGYKRKDIALDLSSPAAVLTTKDFTFEIAYALEEADPSGYGVTRTLHEWRNPDLLAVPEFDALFAAVFSSVRFALTGGVRVEAVIDAIESLDDDAGLRVDYPSDCRCCEIRVEGVEATASCDGASLELRFPRPGSPGELIREFSAVRDAFALSKDRALAALLR